MAPGRKRIIVACGSGVASSSLVANRLKDLLPKHGIKNVDVDVVSFKNAKREAQNADLFVIIAPRGDTNYDCPVVDGVVFMTRRGQEETLQEMKEILESD